MLCVSEFSKFLAWISITSAVLRVSNAFPDIATTTAISSSTQKIISDQNEIVKESYEEESDASSSTQLPQELLRKNGSIPTLPHRDEEQLNTATNLVLAQNLKYDVEILESSSNKKDNIELEERFRGNGLRVNANDIVAENIEVAPESVAQSHIILSIGLIVMAVVSIAIYAGLVIWRAHLEQRYGMRELLVNRDDDNVEYPTASPYSYPTTMPYALSQA